MIADQNYVAITLNFSTVEMLCITPHHLRVMTRAISIGIIEYAALIERPLTLYGIRY